MQQPCRPATVCYQASSAPGSAAWRLQQVLVCLCDSSCAHCSFDKVAPVHIHPNQLRLFKTICSLYTRTTHQTRRDKTRQDKMRLHLPWLIEFQAMALPTLSGLASVEPAGRNHFPAVQAFLQQQARFMTPTQGSCSSFKGHLPHKCPAPAPHTTSRAPETKGCARPPVQEVGAGATSPAGCCAAKSTPSELSLGRLNQDEQCAQGGRGLCKTDVADSANRFYSGLAVWS